MVDSTRGDGIVRNVIYAKWRDDKDPSPGYSRELICSDTDKSNYDEMEVHANPPFRADCKTFLDYFEK